MLEASILDIIGLPPGDVVNLATGVNLDPSVAFFIGVFIMRPDFVLYVLIF